MAEKEQSLGRWQKEFFENIHLFKRSGMSEEEAKKVLQKFFISFVHYSDAARNGSI